MERSKRWLLALLMLVLVPLEVACAYLAFETLGEVTSMLYFIAVAVNLLFILLAIRRPGAAAVGAFVLGLVIIPYQAVLGQRLIRVQAEAARIVSYAYEERLESGEFPADLAGYAFHDPGTESYIQNYSLSDEYRGFVLAYRVGTENTSHTYSPKDGWSYYPD
jgi:hypothetical protein